MGEVTEQAESSSTTTVGGASSSNSGGGGMRSSRRNLDIRMRSVVEDQGVYNSACGYCKAAPRNSIAHGLWAYGVTVQDYQELLDRGWRRSGMFLYKPCMKTTCCPSYTIRLKAESFVASKEQLRVLGRMQRFLDGKLERAENVGVLHKENENTTERGKCVPNDEHLASISDRTTHYKSLTVNTRSINSNGVPDTAATDDKETLARLKAAIETALKICVDSGSLPPSVDFPTILVKQVPQKVKVKLKNLEGQIDYTSSFAFALSAVLRGKGTIEIREEERLRETNDTDQYLSPQDLAEMLVNNLLELSEPIGFTAKALRGHLNFTGIEEKCSSLPVVQAIAEKACGGIKTKIPAPVESRTTSFSEVRRLEIRMKRSAFDAEEFALYKKYQVLIHNDRPQDVKEASYRRFLVDSPLIFVPPANDGTTPSCGFGSFHQQYLINGRLVAVGVIDILPNCLSSKYLFWDPDFAFLSLGKYSALKEVTWVQDAQKVCPSLQYYYLGFYIHTCPKMRYKASYYPSELLCPERFRWVSYELCKPYLDKQSYVCLSTILVNQHLSAGTSSRKKGRKKGQADSTSGVIVQSGQNDMEIEDFDGSVGNDLRSGDDLLPILDDVQIYLKGACLSFKNLQELSLVPRRHMGTLVRNLQRYLEVVGPSLGTRMAYALS